MMKSVIESDAVAPFATPVKKEGQVQVQDHQTGHQQQQQEQQKEAQKQVKVLKNKKNHMEEQPQIQTQAKTKTKTKKEREIEAQIEREPLKHLQKPKKDKKKKQKKENLNNMEKDECDFDELNEIENELENDIDIKGIPRWILNLMEFQPILNIMTIGDVSHGKSTLMWGLSDEKTGRDSREIKRNMTIKLGYTSCKIFKCINCKLSNNICYFSTNSNITTKRVKCPKCNVKAPYVILVRHVSFVDCPGHAQFMGTMISAVCVADGAMMVIDASRPFPGNQTVQHTSAAHVLGVLTNGSSFETKQEEKEMDNININLDENEEVEIMSKNKIKVIVAQNKIDLISKQKACHNIDEIRRFLDNYDSNLSQTTPIIPISAQSRLNLDALCMIMVQKYPPYSPRLNLLHRMNHSLCKNDLLLSSKEDAIHTVDGPKEYSMKMNENDNGSLEINIIRSFDVNKPCVLKNIEDVDKLLRGGVLGGVIVNGTISVGDTVCMRPGIVRMRSDARKIISNDETKRMTVNDKIELLLKPKFEYQEIETKVIGLECGLKSLSNAFPGANVGVMLNIDPSLTKSDLSVGNVICAPKRKGIKRELEVFNVFIMSCVRLKPFENVNFGLLEVVKVNVGAARVNGQIVEKRSKINNEIEGIMVVLEKPICARIASKVALTRKINDEWKFAASGIIFSVRRCISKSS